MSWMLPASVCILVAMSVMGAVFGYLYWTYRERYLKFWMFFSLASSLRYLALIGQVTFGKSLALAIAYNLTTVLGALLVVAGAQIFAQGRARRWLGYPFAAGAAWGALAPFSTLSPPAIATPIFFLLGTAYIYVGVVFLRHSLPRRRVSVVLTSTLFILWGVHQYDYPLLRFIEWFAPIGYTIGGTFALATSLGIILTYFEKTREELLEREENFRALFEHAADSILLLEPDPDGQPIIRDVNQSTLDLYGYSREELIGKPVTVLEVEPLSLQAAQARMKNLMETGLLHFSVTHMAKDGAGRRLDVAAKMVRIAGREMVLSSERDVTELVNAQAERDRLNVELAHAQKMESVGRLAGGVAHDFNNMLGVIIGHAELAMNSLPPSSSAHEDLVEVHRAATRSAELTRQLLAFARKQTASPRALNLNEAVEGSLKMLRRLIGEGIALDWRPASPLWPVLIDPAQVDQLLANLVVNAQDAIRGVGTVTIQTAIEVFDPERCRRHPDALPGEYAVLTVRDDGCGMDAQTLRKVFEPFYTTKEVGKGTGLGLSTVYGIVRQNYGFVSVESAVGGGTSFSIHLPRHHAEPVRMEERTGEELPRGSETILLVEDEKSLLTMNERMLKSLGYAVLAAASPARALNMIADAGGRVDLLVTDVVMPRMNGRELADRLGESYPGVRCLFMSGYTSNVIAEQGVIGEGVNFLQKPFSRAQLAVKVRKVLDGER